MIDPINRALNLATMRAETRLRVAFKRDGVRTLYPEQLVDGAVIPTLDEALYVLRRLEVDDKVRLTLTARDEGAVVYQGDVRGFIARGVPSPTTEASIQVDLTDEWAKEMEQEEATYSHEDDHRPAAGLHR